VTNFPNRVNATVLRQNFSRFRVVFDVFIPKKCNALGDRFAFVRFKDVWNVLELLEDLQDVWVYDYNLKVNISRFGRDEPKRESDNPAKPEPHEDTYYNDCFRGERPYCEVANKGQQTASPTAAAVSLPPPPHICTVKVEASVVDLDYLSKCFVGFLKDSTQL